MNVSELEKKMKIELNYLNLKTPNSNARTPCGAKEIACSLKYNLLF